MSSAGGPSTNSQNGTGDMLYNGGPVMQSPRLYAIFWLPAGNTYENSNAAADSNFESLMTRYMNDVAYSPFYDISSQYGDSTPFQITQITHYVASYTDTRAYTSGPSGHTGTPASPLYQSDIADEVAHVLGITGWTTGLNAEFFVFTGWNIESCFDSTRSDGCTLGVPGGAVNHAGDYCAWHSHYTSGTDVIYANMPLGDSIDMHNGGYFCGSDSASVSPNGDGIADTEMSTLSHEHIESLTDPRLDAWHDGAGDGGQEIGDKCAYIYGATNPDHSDVTLSGDLYHLQLEYSNAAHDCVASGPSAATNQNLQASPSPAAPGANVTISDTVSSGATPTGSVQFFDGYPLSGGTQIGATQTLNGSGFGSVATTTLSVGLHQLYAIYQGATAFQAGITGPVPLSILAAQTITFNPLANHTYGDPPFTVSAMASSGLPVSFSIASGPCGSSGLNGSTITITGAGNCTVNADQAGNGTYSAAPQVQQSFTIAQAPQVISFGPLTNRTFGDAPFTVSATGGASGNPVTFSIASGPCTATGTNGSTITMTGAGTCVVQADQAGNANYLAATPVQQSFVVAQAPTTTTLGSSPNPSAFGQSVTFSAHVASVNPAAGVPNGSVNFYDVTVGSVFLGNGTVNLSGNASFSTASLSVGTHHIQAQYSGATNYLASSSNIVSQVVNSCAVRSTLSSLSSYFSVWLPSSPPSSPLAYTQYRGTDGMFNLGSMVGTACANPGTANATATYTGLVSGPATGSYVLGDHLTIQVWMNGPDGGKEIKIMDTTHAHTAWVKTPYVGVQYMTITSP